jgi:5-methylcytosine-specific restriction endonuclease McrA
MNQELRQQVLKRDKHICQNCNRSFSYLQIHHKIPLNENGTDSIDNLISLCYECHFKIHHHNAATGRTRQIKIQDDTYNELTELGEKNETFDDIIKKCVKAYKEKQGKK